jgi:hypothetical protein
MLGEHSQNNPFLSNGYKDKFFKSTISTSIQYTFLIAIIIISYFTHTTGWMERVYHFHHIRMAHNGAKLQQHEMLRDIVHQIIHAQMLFVRSLLSV